MQTTFTPQSTDDIFERLAGAGRAFRQAYPGDTVLRQPVHTVYGGAQLFGPGTIDKIGVIARRYLETYGPNPAVFASASIPVSTHDDEIRAEGEEQP